MAAPFRDEDHGQTRAFAQHIGIARSLLEQLADIPTRMDQVYADDVEQLAREARVLWEGAWEQLAQARTIVAGVGRDVSGYDDARASAGDIFHAVKVESQWDPVRSTTLTYSAPSVHSARRAIDALCAQMPAFVVSDPPPLGDVEVRPGRRLANWAERYFWLLAIAVVAIIALVVWRVT